MSKAFNPSLPSSTLGARTTDCQIWRASHPNPDKVFTCEYAGGCYSTRRDLGGCEFEYCEFRQRIAASK